MAYGFANRLFDGKVNHLLTGAMETARIRRRNAGVRILLVQSEAPGELVEAFYSKVKVHFSSRSEALRSLMRAFLEGEKK